MLPIPWAYFPHNNQCFPLKCKSGHKNLTQQNLSKFPIVFRIKSEFLNMIEQRSLKYNSYLSLHTCHMLWPYSTVYISPIVTSSPNISTISHSAPSSCNDDSSFPSFPCFANSYSTLKIWTTLYHFLKAFLDSLNCMKFFCCRKHSDFHYVKLLCRNFNNLFTCLFSPLDFEKCTFIIHSCTLV